MPLKTPVSVESPLPFGDRRYERLGALSAEARAEVSDALWKARGVIEKAISSGLDAELCDAHQIEDTIEDVLMNEVIRNFVAATSIDYHVAADILLQAFSRALVRIVDDNADPTEQEALCERIRLINRMFDQTVAD